jgi:hypothetical protein
LVIAFFLVNGIEEIEGISEHVAAAASRIAYADFFWGRNP